MMPHYRLYRHVRQHSRVVYSGSHALYWSASAREVGASDPTTQVSHRPFREANLAGAALVHLGPAGLEHEVARVHEAWLGFGVRLGPGYWFGFGIGLVRVAVHDAVVARDVGRVGGRLGGTWLGLGLGLELGLGLGLGLGLVGGTLGGDAGGGVVDEVLAEHAAVRELASLQGGEVRGGEVALLDLARVWG